MLKLNKDQKRIPIGGHQYYERGVIFRGETFDEVVKKLTEFRRFNCLPTGSPDQDVLLHYIKHWPYMVKEDRDAPERIFSNDFLEWRDWVMGLWRNPPKKSVTVKEAKERWKICENCPMNKDKSWPETKESAELTRRAYLLRKGVDVPESLQVCSCFKADLSVFVFTDLAERKPELKDGTPPANCWVGSLVGSSR